MDFKTAFTDGLMAARDAELAKQEIKRVYQDLNKQLFEVSKGKIKIEPRQFEVTRPTLLRIASPFEAPELYWAIAAINTKAKDSTPKELARWSSAREGYPCKISWGEKEVYCEDKQALEKALADLLRDPIVGEILNTLIKTEVIESSDSQT